jgi:hypothetical protein
MPIKRDTMTFYLPLDLESILYPPGVDITNEQLRLPRKLYLNPQQFNIRETKIINEQLTKGGFIVQYWGEQLPEISVTGTTGSAGIEGINVLRMIYRHEQFAMEDVFAKREALLAENAKNSAMQKAQNLQGDATTAILDLVTGGAYSSLSSGISNSIDIITDAYAGGSYVDMEKYQVGAPPNLASFATTMDLAYQGEIFRGFFINFTTQEEANSPGLFTYSFTYKVTRRVGVRKNFMPWHRTPIGPDGSTRQASIPVEGQRLDELTFPYQKSMIFIQGPVDLSGGLPTASEAASTFASENSIDAGVDATSEEGVLIGSDLNKFISISSTE